MVFNWLPLVLIVGIVLVRINAKRVSSASILDCSRQGSNGLYARGCSSKFMRCLKGVEYKYTCPKKLKFNVDSGKCEKKNQVVACLNSNVAKSDIVVKASEPFDCSRRKDGVYGTDKCSSTYYHCSRGHAAEMICPAGLYYNDNLKGCDEMDSIDECDVLNALSGYNERREGHMGKEGEYIERNAGSNRGFGGGGGGGGGVGGKRRLSLGRGSSDKKRRGRNIHSRTGLIWNPQNNFNCVERSDGNYAFNDQACTSAYWQCKSNQVFSKVCENGMIFNNATRECDLPDSVVACNESNKTAKQAVYRAAPDFSHINCSIQSDGSYALGKCSAYYVICSRRNTILMRCHSGKVYDPASVQCKSINLVKECKVTGKSPLIWLEQAHNTTSKHNKIIPAPEIDEFCNATGDGLYPAGCSNYFYYCGAGKGFRLTCPTGLFFESGSRACDSRSRVWECSHTAAVQTKNASTVNDPKYPKASFDYHLLKNEISKQSVVEQMADKHLYLKSDSNTNPSTNEMFLNDSPVNVASELNCLNRPDGAFAIECSNKFLMCSNGRTSIFNCPHGLTFDEVSKKCNIPILTANCATMRSLNNEQSSASDEDEDDNLDVEEETEQNTEWKFRNLPASALTGGVDCTGRVDGLYIEKCQPKYTICSIGDRHTFQCPDGMVMDSAQKLCTLLENVAECK